ncbi:MAG TPA: M20/M25/M40 family metallo-hydrolase [Gammaproteobacteria bacterium]|nr:M20/M25/M40 family metallo-hydrolase [Gammaproteobacteria bacterium]
MPLSGEESSTRVRLEQHVHCLAEVIGERNMWHHPALGKAADYIFETFRSCEYTPLVQEFSVDGKGVRNVEALLPGADQSQAVIVGAHYDTVPGSPGANDNATGVAAVLELARLLREFRPGREIRFVAFVNEEQPFFATEAMGSWRYAKRCASRGETISAMLSLETIGYYSDEPGSQHYPFPFGLFYPTRGNFIGFVGNLRSGLLVRKVVESFRRNAEFPSEAVAAPGWMTGIGWSDHWAFWKAGYPGVMVTDTALFRYTQYHTAADTQEVVDVERMARVVHGLAKVMRDLAGERS